MTDNEVADVATTELIPTPHEIDYQKLLEENTTLKKMITALAKTDAEAADQKRISSRQAKVESWFGAQDDLPAERVRDLRRRMTNFVDDLFAKVHLDEARELTPDEARSLMAELQDAEEFKVVFEARRNAAKRMVFDHLTAEKIREGVPEPDNHNGWLEVPDLNKKFCREGTGRKDPIMRASVLKELLGEDWAKVVDREHHPEFWTENLNDDKLMALARQQPAVLEKVRAALQLGEVKTPNFRVRDL